MTAPIRPPVVTDYDDPNQRQTRTAIRQLNQPDSQKNTVKAVKLGGSTVSVPHNLGRVPVGWQITDKNAQADVWRDGTANANTIPLKASATVTVDLIFW